MHGSTNDHANERRINLLGRLAVSGRVAAAGLFVMLAVTLSSPHAASAQTREDCIAVGAGNSWTAQENWAWERLCNYETADLGTFLDGSATTRSLPSEWANDRVLRESYLRSILIEEPFVSALTGRPIVIRGADLVDEACQPDGRCAVDLPDLRIDGLLAFEYSRFSGGATMTHGRFAGRLSLVGSEFAEPLNLAYTTFDSVDLSNGMYNEVNVQNTVVASDLVAAGARVSRLFTANAASIGGSLVLRNGCFHVVSAVSVRVGVDLVADGSSFHDAPASTGQAAACARNVTLDDASQQCLNSEGIEGEGGAIAPGRFDANASTIAGSLLLREEPPFARERQGCFKGLNVLSSHIGGQLDTVGSVFDRSVRLNGSSIDGTVFLRFAEFRGSLDLEVTSIGGNVSLEHATFFGELSLLNSEIEGSLILVHDEESDPPNPLTWQPGSSLVLTGTSTIAVSDRSTGPSAVPSAWPMQIGLDGFEYGAGGTQSGFLDRETVWYAEWLRRDDSFPHQPYQQLEQSLRSSGRPDAANEVAILRRDRELSDKSLAMKAPWALWGWTVGYGYEPERALWWIGGIVLLGAAMARSIDKRTRAYLGIGGVLRFSAARAIPFPRHGRAHEIRLQKPRVHWVVRYYFVMHTFVGYVIPLYIVALVTFFVRA